VLVAPGSQEGGSARIPASDACPGLGVFGEAKDAVRLRYVIGARLPEEYVQGKVELEE
jgi:hypothetical protein